MLLRHAKSDWADSELGDQERPLNPRGKKAAWSMGQKLAQNDLIPERILCSTACRTVQTLQGILQTLSQYSQRGVPEILYFDELYLANPETIVRVAHENHGGRSSVMCIGHNPGMELLASGLCAQEIEMKTAHLIVFEKQTETEKPAYWGNASEMYKGWKMTGNFRGEDDGGQER
jgi:phosphohistidine phosphatase